MAAMAASCVLFQSSLVVIKEPLPSYNLSIGFGIAHRLLDDGARVLVSALSKEQLDRPELDGVPGFVGDLARRGGIADPGSRDAIQH